MRIAGGLRVVACNSNVRRVELGKNKNDIWGWGICRLDFSFARVGVE